MNNKEITWLTKNSFERLTKELEDLKKNKRPDVVKRIEYARAEGDLKENGGYHAAKEEQGKIEGRIKRLKYILENAQYSTDNENINFVTTISPGVIVVADIENDEERFLLGSREICEDVNLEVYSENSPLGKAIIGLKRGDKAKYVTPNGRKIQVLIKNIEIFHG